MQFSLKLYFYWCDMEERENAATARKMYAELAEGGLWGKATLEVYEKYLQFEIREKQWANAKGIFDTMLAVFQEDHAALSYILVEYCEFVIKYYKDFEYSKKLLKTYFDLLPYNEYLFTNYLEFMKNFENKEGYYDELMLLIQDALVKAKKGLNEKDLAAAIKMVKYYLRSTLSSIYLIKVS